MVTLMIQLIGCEEIRKTRKWHTFSTLPNNCQGNVLDTRRRDWKSLYFAKLSMGVKPFTYSAQFAKCLIIYPTRVTNVLAV